MKIWNAIKSFLKRFLPPPIKAFNREVARILTAIEGQHNELIRLNALQMNNAGKIAGLHKQNEALLSAVAAQAEQIKILVELQNKFAEIKADIKSAERCIGDKQADWERETSLEFSRLREGVSEINESIRYAEQSLSGEQTKVMAAVSQAVDSIGAEMSRENGNSASRQKELLTQIDKARRCAVDGSRNASEAVWAAIFNNSIASSTWLENKTFSPGRWAVGYPYLYVMYRVLNESRPKRILELGLGQSTRMISQYARAHEAVEHIIVEHDPEWISFFENDFELSPQSHIVKLDREMIPYKEAEAVRVFKDFKETFSGQKFDFISIDAPLGGDMKCYSRIDLLKILPDCLLKTFVIQIDDCDRIGEQNTVVEISDVLKKNNINYKKGKYCGNKDSVVFCSENLAFLTTM